MFQFIAFKALLTIHVSMFLLTERPTNSTLLSCIKRRDFSHAGRGLQHAEAFPVGTVGGHCFFSSRAG